MEESQKYANIFKSISVEESTAEIQKSKTNCFYQIAKLHYQVQQASFEKPPQTLNIISSLGNENYITQQILHNEGAYVVQCERISESKPIKKKRENKNILKIYYHAFMKFISSIAFNHKDQIEKIVPYARYRQHLRKIKNIKVMIPTFRDVIEKGEGKKCPYNKVTRILINKFLNEEKISYFVANKKVVSLMAYFEQRNVFKKTLAYPECFVKFKFI